MLRTVALGLTALTGFGGLVYEVAWQRYLLTLLGSDSEAVASILAIYLGGLSVGYRLFARSSGVIIGLRPAYGSTERPSGPSLAV